MASNISVRLKLVGPRAGQTVVLQDRQFVNGFLDLIGPPRDISGAASYLLKCYGAYVDGSEECEKAEARYEALLEEMEAGNGNGDASSGSKPDPSKPVRGAVRPDGGGSSEASVDDGGSDAQDQRGGAGVLSAGDRYENSRVHPEPDGQKRSLIAEALRALDHGNPEHWTQDGKPAVAVVSDVAGENISRQMIEAVSPHFVRALPKK